MSEQKPTAGAHRNRRVTIVDHPSTLESERKAELERLAAIERALEIDRAAELGLLAALQSPRHDYGADHRFHQHGRISRH